jgi:hypothetical protein
MLPTQSPCSFTIRSQEANETPLPPTATELTLAIGNDRIRDSRRLLAIEVALLSPRDRELIGSELVAGCGAVSVMVSTGTVWTGIVMSQRVISGPWCWRARQKL